MLCLCPSRRSNRLWCLCFPPLIGQTQAQVPSASWAWSCCIHLRPNSPLRRTRVWIRGLSSKWIPQFRLHPPLTSPAKYIVWVCSWLLIPQEPSPIICNLHSIHLQAFALACPGTDFVSSSCYDSCWHPESLPASIVAMSCRRSFFLPSLLWVSATWSNQVCFQWTVDHCLPAALSKASLVLLYRCTSILVCPFEATTKVWLRAWVPSNLFVVNLEAASGNFNCPCAPTFSAYVSCDCSQAFLSSLRFAQVPYPKCKEDRWPPYFCLSQEWHPPLHDSHLAKLSFCLGVLGRLSAMLHCNWLHLVPLAPFASACIHDHWVHWFSPILPAGDYQHPPRRLSTPFLMLVANSLFVDCSLFALFCLGPSLSTIPHSPLHTLLSEGRLLSGYCNLDINILAYYYAV